MNNTHNKQLSGFARQLRRQMTREERHLWYDFLKQLPVTINRQKVIGGYIADFYCAQRKTVIELDGSQHFEEKSAQEDAIRNRYMESLGITVLRYANSDVSNNFTGVCQDILQHLDLPKASPGGEAVSRMAD